MFLGCLFFWGIFAVCFGFVQSVGMTIVMRGCRESGIVQASADADPLQWDFLQDVVCYHGQ